MSTNSAVSTDEVLERAGAQAELDDFGPDSVIEGLERVLEAIANPPEGFRSPQVVQTHYDLVVSLLVNRARVVDYAKTHPDVVKRGIERPLFILGLPRTGSTVTSYLLDQDPTRRSLLLWEAYDTVPPATRATLRTDPRAIALRARQDAAVARDPTVAQVHWEWADGPTQCTEVHGHDFRATVFDRTLPSPDYMSWLEDTDMTSAYEYQKLVLQILQSAAPGAWTLKTPAHAMYIESLLTVFPDAQLVWTHRDPYRAAASVLSSKVKGLEATYGRAALDLVLSYYPRNLGKHVERMLRVRDRLGPGRVYDLYYARLMRDPIDELRRLYTWAGMAFNDEVAANMRGYLRENPQYKFGKRPYGLDALGNARTRLEPLFAEYLETFTIEPEGTE
jgi:hypothetical protein